MNEYISPDECGTISLEIDPVWHISNSHQYPIHIPFISHSYLIHIIIDLQLILLVLNVGLLGLLFFLGGYLASGSFPQIPY
jgi:hypothetical protein